MEIQLAGVFVKLNGISLEPVRVHKLVKTKDPFHVLDRMTGAIMHHEYEMRVHT